MAAQVLAVMALLVAGASLATVAALNVHITYLRETMKDHGERLRQLEAGR